MAKTNDDSTGKSTVEELRAQKALAEQSGDQARVDDLQRRIDAAQQQEQGGGQSQR